MNSLKTLNLGDALVRNSGALAIATALKRGATNLEVLSCLKYASPEYISFPILLKIISFVNLLSKMGNDI